jgi:hypothetical protein
MAKDSTTKKFNPGPPPVAGAGSKVTSKPNSRYASGYMPEENVNEGPHGGKKGGVTPAHGQNTYDATEQNKLVGQSDYQKDPYRAKGSDFPVKHVDSAFGQSGMHGFSSGHNELVKQSVDQEGPRHGEDDGPMTPVPADKSRIVAAGQSIGVSKGESSSDTGEIGIEQYVDLQTGYVKGGNQGVTDYVPDKDLSIGSPIKVTKDSGQVGQKRS